MRLPEADLSIATLMQSAEPSNPASQPASQPALPSLSVPVADSIPSSSLFADASPRLHIYEILQWRGVRHDEGCTTRLTFSTYAYYSTRQGNAETHSPHLSPFDPNLLSTQITNSFRQDHHVFGTRTACWIPCRLSRDLTTPQRKIHDLLWNVWVFATLGKWTERAFHEGMS
jgi:hypothetical protein